jgi:hypothetical protein
MNYPAATLPLSIYPKRNQEISPFKGLRSVGMSGVSGIGEVGKNEDKNRESGKRVVSLRTWSRARNSRATSRFFPAVFNPPDS